jgi:HAD superfamily hydrolase (TIGR01490 family)
MPLVSPRSPTVAGRPAAFFDLDKTVIARSATLAFAGTFFRRGLIGRHTLLRSALGQLVFMVGGASAGYLNRVKAATTSVVTGWDAARIRAIVAEELPSVIAPLVFAEAAELIRRHRERGEDVVLVSASGQDLVAPIGRLVGAGHTIGTVMVERDGRYTGEVAFYCYGPNKAAAIVDLARRNGYDLARSHAYSDSITDLPMLAAVGRPVVVNPDRALRRMATARGWPILAFTRPRPTRIAGPARRRDPAARTGQLPRTPTWPRPRWGRWAPAPVRAAAGAVAVGIGIYAALHGRRGTPGRVPPGRPATSAGRTTPAAQRFPARSGAPAGGPTRRGDGSRRTNRRQGLAVTPATG